MPLRNRQVANLCRRESTRLYSTALNESVETSKPIPNFHSTNSNNVTAAANQLNHVNHNNVSQIHSAKTSTLAGPVTDSSNLNQNHPALPPGLLPPPGLSLDDSYATESVSEFSALLNHGPDGHGPSEIERKNIFTRLNTAAEVENNYDEVLGLLSVIENYVDGDANCIEKPVQAYNMAIKACGKSFAEEEVYPEITALYDRLLSRNIPPTPHTFATIIQQISSSTGNNGSVNNTSNSGDPNSSLIPGTVNSINSKSKTAFQHSKYWFEVFQKEWLPKYLDNLNDVEVVYTSMIQACFKAGMPDMADEYFQQLMANAPNFTPTVVTYGTLIFGFANSKTCNIPGPDIKRALDYYNHMWSNGVHPSAQCYTSIMGYYCEKKDMLEAERWMSTMLNDHNVVVDAHCYNKLIDGYIRLSDGVKAVQWWDNAKNNVNINQNETRAHGLVRLLAGNDATRHLTEKVFVQLNDANVTCYNILLSTFVKDGNYEKACYYFEEMKRKHASKKSQIQKSRSKLRLEPNDYTFYFMMRAAQGAKRYDHAIQIFQNEISHAQKNTQHYNLMLRIFLESGDRNSACYVQSEMIERGFALDNLSRKALDEMPPQNLTNGPGAGDTTWMSNGVDNNSNVNQNLNSGNSFEYPHGVTWTDVPISTHHDTNTDGNFGYNGNGMSIKQNTNGINNSSSNENFGSNTTNLTSVSDSTTTPERTGNITIRSNNRNTNTYNSKVVAESKSAIESIQSNLNNKSNFHNNNSTAAPSISISNEVEWEVHQNGDGNLIYSKISEPSVQTQIQPNNTRWVRTTDADNGKSYYWNVETQQTQWENPSAASCQ